MDIPKSLFVSCLDYVPLINRSFHFVAKITFGDVANISLPGYEVQFLGIFLIQNTNFSTIRSIIKRNVKFLLAPGNLERLQKEVR